MDVVKDQKHVALVGLINNAVQTNDNHKVHNPSVEETKHTTNNTPASRKITISLDVAGTVTIEI